MAEMLGRVANAPDPGVLLGLEGQSAAVYFGNFGRMLKAKGPGSSFDFTTRNRRPPRDPVNALLSFAYALLDQRLFLGRLHRRLRSVPGILPYRPPRPPFAGVGFDGGVSAGDCGFCGAEPDQ